ncbi:MAG TPA: amidohydrolase family protein [Terracidiphilus sp.]|nr:amidohydrolase family protein [Terracidiphilus sp.]
MLDAHQHFWKVDRGDYAWMTPDLTALYRDFGPDDLSPLLQQAGIARTVLIQAAETEAETEYLLGVAARTDFVAGVVGWVDMLADDFPARLAHYATQPKWVGIRPMLQEHDPSLINDPRFRASLSEIARRGIPFDILTYPRHLSALIHAVQATPGLRAILDHVSKPDMTRPMDAKWCSEIEALAGVPGIYCKISGLVTEAGNDWSIERIRPFVEFVARAFGPERLIFGSDWPVCMRVASYMQVLELARSILSSLYGPEAMQAIMETNGLRFYRLESR